MARLEKKDGFSRWAGSLVERRDYWRAVIAIAARNALLTWAVLKFDQGHVDELSKAVLAKFVAGRGRGFHRQHGPRCFATSRLVCRAESDKAPLPAEQQAYTPVPPVAMTVTCIRYAK